MVSALRWPLPVSAEDGACLPHKSAQTRKAAVDRSEELHLVAIVTGHKDGLVTEASQGAGLSAS